jgi:hypothetical protein
MQGESGRILTVVVGACPSESGDVDIEIDAALSGTTF